MSLKLLLWMVLSFVIIGCNSITPLPIYDQKLNPNEKTVAEQAYSVFYDVCKPLMSKYSGDIESIEISKGFDRQNTSFDKGCMDYRCMD